jgi:hypothetical protein
MQVGEREQDLEVVAFAEAAPSAYASRSTPTEKSYGYAAPSEIIRASDTS